LFDDLSDIVVSCVSFFYCIFAGTVVLVFRCFEDCCQVHKYNKITIMWVREQDL